MVQVGLHGRSGALVRIVAIVLLSGALVAPARLAAAQATLLPGVPASVVLVARFDIDLAAGAYRWQTTNLAVTKTTEFQAQTHRGFVIATDESAQLKDADGVIVPVPEGGAAQIHEGELVVPSASGNGTAHLTFVELPLVSQLNPNETPDRTQPVTLKDGSYTIAVLQIPVGANAPTLGQIVRGAAAPAIAVYPPAQGGEATPAPQGGNKPGWLVAIFPRT